MYQWWVFVHLVGVFGFLVAHGVSVGVSFRLRAERDPGKIAALLDLSSRSIGPMWVSIGVLLAGGIVAGFQGSWWGYGWIWASIGVLVVVIVIMALLATRYYSRVRLVTGAMTGGSEAVSAEEFDRVLRSARPVTIAVVGFVGLGLILWMMIFKPTFGLAPRAAAEPDAPPGVAAVEIATDEVAFSTDILRVPADEPFAIVFDNQSRGVPHNVAVYEDESAADARFVGDIINGPMTITYRLDPLEAGGYFFRCDVHPTTITGTVEAA
ncbi:MAG: cupredoxin domain-containing protein [Actinomycetota bacterium]